MQHVPAVPRGVRVGWVLFVAARGGGVGKSTTSVHLAELAAQAGIKVLLVDTDRAQSDVYKRLGLSGSTITEVASQWSGHPEDLVRFVVGQESHRAAGRDLSADYLLGPVSTGASDKRGISDDLYVAVLNAACQIWDLVVVDTHPVDTSDPDNQFRRAFLPRLLSPRSRDRVVVMSDWDKAKAWDALEWMTSLTDVEGLPSSKIAVLFNGFDHGNDFGLSTSILTRFSRFQQLGLLPRSDVVKRANNQQHLGFVDSEYKAAVASALHGLTGDPRFEPTEPSGRRFRLPRFRGRR